MPNWYDSSAPIIETADYSTPYYRPFPRPYSNASAPVAYGDKRFTLVGYYAAGNNTLTSCPLYASHDKGATWAEADAGNRLTDAPISSQNIVVGKNLYVAVTEETQTYLMLRTFDLESEVWWPFPYATGPEWWGIPFLVSHGSGLRAVWVNFNYPARIQWANYDVTADAWSKIGSLDVSSLGFTPSIYACETNLSTGCTHVILYQENWGGAYHVRIFADDTAGVPVTVATSSQIHLDFAPTRLAFSAGRVQFAWLQWNIRWHITDAPAPYYSGMATGTLSDADASVSWTYSEFQNTPPATVSDSYPDAEFSPTITIPLDYGDPWTVVQAGNGIFICLEDVNYFGSGEDSDRIYRSIIGGNPITQPTADMVLTPPLVSPYNCWQLSQSAQTPSAYFPDLKKVGIVYAMWGYNALLGGKLMYAEVDGGTLTSRLRNYTDTAAISNFTY